MGFGFGEDLVDLLLLRARFGFRLGCFSCLLWGFLRAFGFGKNLVDETLFVLLRGCGGGFLWGGFRG
jgi:hypothetical protein